MMTGAVLALRDLALDDRPARIRAAWAGMFAPARMIYNRLLTAGFRSGVSRGPLAWALAGIAGIDPAEMAHRLVGGFEPDAARYPELLRPAGGVDDPGKPYPFLLALPLDGDPARLGDPARWLVEWKWDGIRAQILRRGRACMIWTRGEEMIGDQFPPSPPAPTPSCPAPCSTARSSRPGRRALHRLRPDRGGWPRSPLRTAGHPPPAPRPARRAGRIRLFRPGPVRSLGSPRPLRAAARQHGAEGLMLAARRRLRPRPRARPVVEVEDRSLQRRRRARLRPGRFGGRLLRHHPRRLERGPHRARLQDRIRPLRRRAGILDRFVLAATLEKFWPRPRRAPRTGLRDRLRRRPSSTRHKSGVTLRNPRVLRPRPDKTAPAADTLESIHAHLV
ncbi:MAG: hypothetical protein U1G05_07210 [Kiritimatiellia bacterium]